MIKHDQKLVQISDPSSVDLPWLGVDNDTQMEVLGKQIAKDIDEYCAKAYDDGPRSHLGASVIGHDCDRYIWFEFRWMKRQVFDGRMQRLFQRGHWEEDHFIDWLRGIGFDIQQVTIDGKQFHVAAINDHFGGSSDCRGTMPERYGNQFKGIKFLLEFKTQKGGDT